MAGINLIAGQGKVTEKWLIAGNYVIFIIFDSKLDTMINELAGIDKSKTSIL